MRAGPSEMPTSFSISTLRLKASCFEIFSCWRYTSISCMPIVNTGFSDVIGS